MEAAIQQAKAPVTIANFDVLTLMSAAFRKVYRDLTMRKGSTLVSLVIRRRGDGESFERGQLFPRADPIGYRYLPRQRAALRDFRF